MITLNKAICDAHLKTLKTANEQWFYGYAFTSADMQHLKEALAYFEYVKNELQKTLEGKSNG